MVRVTQECVIKDQAYVHCQLIYHVSLFFISFYYQHVKQTKVVVSLTEWVILKQMCLTNQLGQQNKCVDQPSLEAHTPVTSGLTSTDAVFWKYST
jgi:hypothetical protein